MNIFKKGNLFSENSEVINMKDNAIIQPVNRKKLSLTEPLILISAESDLRALLQLLDLKQLEKISLMMSTVYKGLSDSQPVSLIGPMIGAPYATLVLEEAIAAGAKKILFFGQCGSLTKSVEIGHCIVPDGSLIDEGTSRCYPITSDISFSDMNFSHLVAHVIRQTGQTCHMGRIWCTDGLYQETPEKVRFYQEKQAIGVEMETSALFTVANYRKVSMAALLIVSDHLYTFSWQHGFGSQAYKQGLKKSFQALCEIIKQD
jgi:purine-nucleoside phosphorylase